MNSAGDYPMALGVSEESAPNSGAKANCGRFRPLICTSFIGLLGVLALPLQSTAAVQDEIGLKLSQLGAAASQQRQLQEEIASVNSSISRLGGQIAQLRNREGVVQSKLDETRVRLALERRRYRHLRRKLRKQLKTLAERLRDIYASNDPNVLSVALKANGWRDLLTRVEFIRKIGEQDRAIVKRVKLLKRQSRDKKKLLVTLAAQILAERNRLAATRAGLERQGNALVAERSKKEAIAARVASQRQAIASSLANLRAQVASANVASTQGSPASGSGEPGPGAGSFGNPGFNPAAPSDAPGAVDKIIAAANQIAGAPYKWGGGHGSLNDSGYDCSGTVSYTLAKAGLLDSARDSTGFESYGQTGPGKHVTIYANAGHAFMKIHGKTFDTSNLKQTGSRWGGDRSGDGYVVRHPPGL